MAVHFKCLASFALLLGWMQAVGELFGALDKVDEHLATHRYLAGEYCTEAD